MKEGKKKQEPEGGSEIMPMSEKHERLLSFSRGGVVSEDGLVSAFGKLTTLKTINSIKDFRNYLGELVDNSEPETEKVLKDAAQCAESNALIFLENLGKRLGIP